GTVPTTRRLSPVFRLSAELFGLRAQLGDARRSAALEVLDGRAAERERAGVGDAALDKPAGAGDDVEQPAGGRAQAEPGAPPLGEVAALDRQHVVRLDAAYAGRLDRRVHGQVDALEHDQQWPPQPADHLQVGTGLVVEAVAHLAAVHDHRRAPQLIAVVRP